MDCTLQRDDYRSTGIFGSLLDSSENEIAVTLEHAYQNASGLWLPKIPAGTYVCALGQHQLLGMSKPFMTYEVLNVPGHSKILLHTGNVDADSEGCVLIGTDRVGDEILQSRVAFHKLMALQSGASQFKLKVLDS